MEQEKLIPDLNSNIEKDPTFENDKKKRSKSKENSIRNRLRKNPQKSKIIYSTDELKSNDLTKSIPEKEYKICKFILDKIKKHEKSSSFRQPAIRSFYSQRDKELYKSIIIHPQDLGHITKKLNSKKYLTLQEFYDDLTLIWDNAQIFNAKTSLIYRDSLYMSKYVDRLFNDKDLLCKIQLNHNGKKMKNINTTNEDGNDDNENNGTDTKNNSSLTCKKRKRNDKINDKYYTNEKTSPPIINESINMKNIDSYEEDKKNDSIMETNEKESNNVEMGMNKSSDYINPKDNLDNKEEYSSPQDIQNNNNDNLFPGKDEDYMNYQNDNNDFEQYNNESKDNDINQNNIPTCYNYNIEKTNNPNNNQYLNNNEQSYYNLRGNYNTPKTNANNTNCILYSDVIFNNKYFKNYEAKLNFLRHLISRQFDKLNDDDMFGLIEYIEEIRPQAIVEKPEDVIDIDMTKFIEETYHKLIRYFREILLKKRMI